MPDGRWYWFRCRACKWRGVRYRNVKVCPKCRQPLLRFRAARLG